MRRTTAFSAFVSLLLVIVYAPLFHVHETDHHHGNTSSTVHAHFPEAHHQEDHHSEPEGEHIEAVDDHVASSVDVFAMAAPCLVPTLFVAVEQPLVPRPSDGCAGFATVETPRAHDPPSSSSIAPRSPPV
jgi:hypothetical protein